MYLIASRRASGLRLFLTAVSLIACTYAGAQNNVGINTITPDPSAALDVTATNQGMLAPRMTQAQRGQIAAPATGLLVYQTDNTPGFYFYNGSAWGPVGGGTSSSTGLQLYATSNTAQTTIPFGYNRYLFSFAHTVSGTAAAAWTNGNTFTVPAGMGGLYEFSVNLVETAFTGFASPPIPTPEVEVTRGATRLYHYGVGISSALFQGDNTNGTTIGSTGAPFSYARGLAQVAVPLLAGDVVKVYFRPNQNATSSTYTITFSTDGSTNLKIVKLN